jgi:hypothetical protein
MKSSPAEFKPFVSVRVAEIQENQPTAVWNYINSETNPADALTRGITPVQLQLWHHGPQFIQKPENEWPDFKRSSTVHNSVQPDPERKRKSKSKFMIDLLQLTQSNTSETEGVNNAFNIDESETTSQ